MSENHITGKAEARAQAGGMLQAGSNQAYVAEAVKIIFESSERLVEEEVISKIPCGWEEEWKAFISEKSQKNGYFQISSQKGMEHQKISY